MGERSFKKALLFNFFVFFGCRPNLESYGNSLLHVKSNCEGPIYNNWSWLFDSLSIMLKRLLDNISGLRGIPHGL